MKILIIESGSTKTEWRVISDPNTAFDSFFSAGINPYYQSLNQICDAQKSVLLNIPSEDIEYIYYYGTGITGDDKKEIIRNFLLTHFKPTSHIGIENDLIAVLKSSLGDESGIACILGTGSNSGFSDGNQVTEQIPPLGFWLGDEGSGGHLGKLLILAYLHQEMPEDLRSLFIKRFGELSRLNILTKAYKEEFPNRWFASFSKFLFDHRKHPFCYQIIEHSFEEFTRLYLLKYKEAHHTPVHFTGSVAFYYSDILKRVLKKHQIQVGIISESPMAGLTLYHKNKIWPKN
jgi:glucosamine kinase